LGRIVIEKLKAKIPTADIVALVRTPSKAADLGVEVRAFDYDKSESLAESLQGIDKLLLISASEPGKRMKQHENAINAAKTAGVKFLAYTSLLRADSTTLVLGPEHLGTEELVKASGIPYAILRHGWYTENYFGGLEHVIESGELVGSAGEGKISAATREDFADADVAVLLGEGHNNKTYEMAGDSAFTLAEFANTLGEVSGKTITYKNLPINDFAAALAQGGLPEPVAQFFAGTHVATEKGDLFDESNEISKLAGRPTTSLKAAFRKFLNK
ncbi:MAG: SDR family oxidoreductase, partial [Chitinophagaceae bacterium]